MAFYVSSSYDSCRRLYDNETIFSTPASNHKTFFTFFLISLIVLIGAIYLNPNGTDLPPPEFCMNQETWAPEFCIVSNPFELSSPNQVQEQDNNYVKPPMVSIKSMEVSTEFLLKEANQVWEIKMSLQNPNLRMNVSYDWGTVDVMYGTRKLGTRSIKYFNQASWGHRLISWKFISNALVFGSEAVSIKQDVANKGSAVFRVLMKTIIRVYPSSSSFSSMESKRYQLFAHCDELKIDFPSGTLESSGTRRCQVQLMELNQP